MGGSVLTVVGACGEDCGDEFDRVGPSADRRIDGQTIQQIAVEPGLQV
jgi:hypothetical protein